MVLKRRRWNPVLALPGLDMLNVHGIYLLESAAVTFIHEEVRYDGTRTTAGAEHIAVPVVDGAGDEGREEAQEEIPCPVRCGG